jgi:hypothetical protein
MHSLRDSMNKRDKEELVDSNTTVKNQADRRRDSCDWRDILRRVLREFKKVSITNNMDISRAVPRNWAADGPIFGRLSGRTIRKYSSFHCIFSLVLVY